jgi:adenylate kinase family enzyme
MRRVIIGGPRTGKTTLARRLSERPLHTDDHMRMGWSESSQYVADRLNDPTVECVEGVTAVRALRKWLKANPEGKPCDEVIHLTEPKEGRTEGQDRMAKATDTIFREIRPELERRGVRIDERK